MAVTSLDNLVIYRRTDDRALIPLVSPATLLGANSTSNAAVTFGFNFEFDGAVRTGGQVFAYGYLRLAGTINSSINSNLFAAGTTTELIAPLYDFLETADTVGYIQAETQGAAPCRRCVIEWYVNLRQGQTGAVYDRMKFQCVLYETSNKIEFRYGDVETLGSPTRTSYSASIGVKGSTFSVATNFRDAWVENRTLGGSNTTSTQTIAYPGTWPAWTLVIQPAYPMCGRVLVVGPERLSGLQDLYSEPLQSFANNVNWHYCNHAPPLVDFSPEYHGGTLVAGTQNFVVPVRPSADGLAYTVYIGTYNSAATTLTAYVDYDAQPDPQPTTGADWTNLNSANLVVGAGGYNWWSTFSITIPAGAEFLRFRLATTAGQAAILSALVVPTALSEAPSSATACGWERVGIAQVVQEGAGLHPELLNRCWLDIARVMRDREQMAWSMVRNDVSDYVMNATAAHAVRTYAVAPACLKGQAGATLEVRLYAYDTGGAVMWVRERGGEVCRLEVAADSEYRLITGTLTLVSETPVIEVTVDTSTGLRVAALTLVWTPGD